MRVEPPLIGGDSCADYKRDAPITETHRRHSIWVLNNGL